jgi:tubulin--tyrosine ligase-like protein 12
MHCKFVSGDALRNALLEHLPQLEIYNSQFTHNYSQWALGFCAGIYGAEKPVGTQQGTHILKDVKELDLSNRSIHNLTDKVRMMFLITLISSLTSQTLKCQK